MSEDYTYDHIPALEELLPSTGGIPGVMYAIVSTKNMRKAQDQGWVRLDGNQKIFTVKGPKGQVDCELFGKGTPIKGADVQAGRRQCFIDNDVGKSTGFGKKAEPAKDPQKKKD